MDCRAELELSDPKEYNRRINQIARRCRARLAKHGMFLGKDYTKDKPCRYYIINYHDEGKRIPDSGKYLSLAELISFCVELSDQDEDYFR